MEFFFLQGCQRESFSNYQAKALANTPNLIIVHAKLLMIQALVYNHLSPCITYCLLALSSPNFGYCIPKQSSTAYLSPFLAAQLSFNNSGQKWYFLRIALSHCVEQSGIGTCAHSDSPVPSYAANNKLKPKINLKIAIT